MNKRLALRIYEYDPGLLRLKQAFKTILAVIITSAILIQANVIIVVCGGLASGFSMQGIYGMTRMEQTKSALINAIIYLIAYNIGAFTHPYPYYATGFLAILGFLTFYSRKFGPRFTVMPMMVWVLSFLGTILPVPADFTGILHSSLAFLLGFIVSLLVYILIFPVRKERSFFNNLENNIDDIHTILIWLKRSFQQSFDSNQFNVTRETKLSSIRKLLLLNESTMEYFTSAHNKFSEEARRLYLIEYTLGKAIGMLMESSAQVLEDQTGLEDKTRKMITSTFNYFIHLTNNIQVDVSSFSIKSNIEKEETKEVLYHFKDMLIENHSIMNHSMIYIINMGLGFRQLWKNLSLLNTGNRNAL